MRRPLALLQLLLLLALTLQVISAQDQDPDHQDETDRPLPTPPTTNAPTQAPTPPPTAAPGDTLAPATAAPPPKDEQWYWEHEEDPRFNTTQFSTFQADDAAQSCSQDKHATPFARQVRGVNLGGWLVLQPSITPSLFYQFLGTQERFGDHAPNKTAMDSYTFCRALGKEEANRQLRIHWASWVSEADISALAAAGVNSLRVPVGDWMFVPYEPYLGCTDGAVEELDRLVDLAAKYDMDVLIDLHGLIGSQNGFDSSGRSTAVKWTSIASTQPVGTTTFEHWPIRMAEWAGTYDLENRNYTSINYHNLNHSLEAVMAIAHRYAGHNAVLGLQPINEPWELTPIKVLKDYYWKSYKRVKALAPKWKFVLHDSFRFGVEYWSEFMRGCPDIALDTHIYQAWNNPGTRADFFSNACKQKNTITDMENKLMPVIVGEWSAATDNCMMWLNGFNDNQPGFPKVRCTLQHCPVDSTYLYKGFPGTPLDKNQPVQGPYGTGYSGPSFGMCEVTSNVSFGQTHPSHERALMRDLVSKKLNAFAVGHGWYFWNFKVELDTRWDFLKLVGLGAFPANVSTYTDADGIDAACAREDNGDFVCRAKRGVQEMDLKAGYNLVCSTYEVDCSTMDSKNMTLEEKCDWAFNEYWHLHRMSGATCDFGGAAHLLMLAHEGGAPVNEISTTTGEAQPNTLLSAFGQPLGVLMILAAGVVVGGVIGTGTFHCYRRRHYTPINGH